MSAALPLPHAPDVTSANHDGAHAVAVVLAALIDDAVRENAPEKDTTRAQSAPTASSAAANHDAPSAAAISSQGADQQPGRGQQQTSEVTCPPDLASPSITREEQSARAPAVDQAASPVPRKLGLKDFVEGRLLGTGSYSTVRLCTFDAKEYAMKVMEKRLILKEKKEKFAKMERDILNLLSHLNIVGMNWCFQDDHSLFFVLDYCSGGELFQQVWPASASPTLSPAPSHHVSVARTRLAVSGLWHVRPC